MLDSRGTEVNVGYKEVVGWVAGWRAAGYVLFLLLHIIAYLVLPWQQLCCAVYCVLVLINN